MVAACVIHCSFLFRSLFLLFFRRQYSNRVRLNVNVFVCMGCFRSFLLFAFYLNIVFVRIIQHSDWFSCCNTEYSVLSECIFAVPQRTSNRATDRDSETSKITNRTSDCQSLCGIEPVNHKEWICTSGEFGVLHKNRKEHGRTNERTNKKKSTKISDQKHENELKEK